MSSEWIEHDGICRPVAADVRVITKMRDGYVNPQVPAGFWGDGLSDESNWWHDPHAPTSVDIIAYKIFEPQDAGPPPKGV